MKKMFAKLGLPSLLSVAFLLGGLFFGANSAQAQTLTAAPGTTTNSPIKTTATWKSVSAAKDALNAEITVIDQSLNTGSGTVAMKMKRTVYAAIVTDLEIGTDVPVAAYHNYNVYSPAAGVDSRPATPGMNNGDWTNLYNDMVELLTL